MKGIKGMRADRVQTFDAAEYLRGSGWMCVRVVQEDSGVFLCELFEAD